MLKTISAKKGKKAVCKKISFMVKEHHTMKLK